MSPSSKAPIPFDFDPKLREWLKRNVEPVAVRPSRVVVTFGAVANVETRVRHKLGRIPEGFRVIEQDRAGSVYRDATTKRADRFTLWLKSSVAALTVSLEVF